MKLLVSWTPKTDAAMVVEFSVIVAPSEGVGGMKAIERVPEAWTVKAVVFSSGQQFWLPVLDLHLAVRVPGVWELQSNTAVFPFQ